MPCYVYIMTNRPGGTLYVGLTNDLVRRAVEHRTGHSRGFTSRYNLDKLVYFETHDSPASAIRREKNIKHWSRAWKIEMIEGFNPDWRDLYDEIAAP